MKKEKIVFILRSILANKKTLLLIAILVVMIAFKTLADPTIQPLGGDDDYPPGDPTPPYPFPT